MKLQQKLVWNLTGKSTMNQPFLNDGYHNRYRDVTETTWMTAPETCSAAVRAHTEWIPQLEIKLTNQTDLGVHRAAVLASVLLKLRHRVPAQSSISPCCLLCRLRLRRDATLRWTNTWTAADNRAPPFNVPPPSTVKMPPHTHTVTHTPCCKHTLTTTHPQLICMQTQTHTPPEARTHLQSLTCFSSDVSIFSHVNTHLHTYTCMCSKPRTKLRTLTSRNRDRAKQTWTKHSPKQHEEFVNMRKMLTWAKGAAGVHCVSHSDYSHLLVTEKEVCVNLGGKEKSNSAAFTVIM